MRKLNSWKRLWISAVIAYLGVVLVGAYMKQPTNADVQVADVLHYISTSTLEMMKTTGQDVPWRESVEDGISVSIPDRLDASLAKAYVTEYLVAHTAALNDLRLEFSVRALACWAIPSLLLLAAGYLGKWVRHGFSASAP